MSAPCRSVCGGSSSWPLGWRLAGLAVPAHRGGQQWRQWRRSRSTAGTLGSILLVVSLGFFMTLLDLTIVNIAIPNMIYEAARLARRHPVGHQRLRARAGRAAHHLRAPGRPVRTAQDVLCRDCAVHACLGGLRPVTVRRLPHRVPRSPGPGCRHADAADAGYPDDGVPSGAQGSGVRRLGRGRGRRDNRRPYPGRPSRHGVRLALHLLHQRAHRRGRARADA